MENHSTLLDGAILKPGTYFIDVDNDQIIFFDKDTNEWLWKTHEGDDDHNGRRCIFMLNDLVLVIKDICPIENWSNWFMKLDNLTKLRASLANVYGLENHTYVLDVQPIITDCLHRNFERLACPVDAAYLAAKEVLLHPPPCKRLPKRATYVTREKTNNSAKLV